MAAHGGPGEREATPQSTYEHAGVQGGSASPGVRDWSEAEGGKRRRSRSDKNGSQTHTSPEPLQVHKKIELSACQYARISEQLVELYETGLSLADIAKQTGKAKNSIREILIRAGVSLRGNRSLPVAAAARSKSKGNIRPYYGFCYFQGRIVPDQREHKHLAYIYQLWRQETNPNRITELLNENKVPPRSASSWNRNSVVNILMRFESGLIKNQAGHLKLQ